MTRGGAAAARVAHNHEVTGSSPVPATKEEVSSSDEAFSFGVTIAPLFEVDRVMPSCG
jgi:hypothetical protein